MGRPKKKIDDMTLLSMRSEGKKLKEISKEMEVSIPTLTRRIAALQHQKGILTKYRELQGLQLTAHQAKILEAVDAKDFKECSLSELISVFNILKKAELTIQGKGTFKIWGLVEHLMALENL